jgi:hypothetical protein
MLVDAAEECCRRVLASELVDEVRAAGVLLGKGGYIVDETRNQD